MAEKLVGPWCVQIVYKQKVSEPNIMQYCEMFSVLVLGYRVYFKLTGPRKYALASTENTCFPHLCEVDFSDTYLMTSAENSIS